MFTLPSGELGVVMGDVAGSGLPAAVIMGRMRSALRAYALETSDPAEVLGRLDRKMQHFEPDALATVLYAVIDPALDRMRVCLAGHFPPVLACPGQPAELTCVAGGLMIGVAAGADRPVSTVQIPPGALLCFYTDGLIRGDGGAGRQRAGPGRHRPADGPAEGLACSARLSRGRGEEVDIDA